VRSPVAWAAILPAALAELALLVATGNRYGYHRDELYFIQAGRHPALGYDDQPPLTPLLGRLSSAVFGDGPRGLRVVSALAIAAVVVLVALIARELGAGSTGQLVTAAATAASTGLMAAGHILSTTTFDLLLWVAIAWLVTRILARGDERLWLVVGLVTGIALENKHLVLLLVGSLALGFACARRLDPLRSRWLWAGAAVALALWAPNLVWQAQHGWPQLDLAGKIAGENPVGYRAQLLPFQLIVLSPLYVPILFGGLRWLLRGEDALRFRPLAYGYLALLAISLLLGAKPYYTGGLLLVLLAAGGVVVERWLRRRGRGAGLVTAAVVVSAVVSIGIALAVIPVADLHATPIPAVNEDAIESVGWPRFVATVARVWRRLPEAERTRAVIFTGNYGEAGAVDRFGRPLGLPRAYSGHNNFARWGIPPGSAGPVIVLGWERREYLQGSFVGCVESARIDNGVQLDNEEQGGPVWTCRAPAKPWAELWPELRHLSP
jgi:4-amino-4-deoxy-L-arabinose transferase-like glycosyltransferase